MTTIDTFQDLIEDNGRWVKWIVQQCADDCLHWQPDAAANSIAVTLWHVARALDVALHQLATGRPGDAELWIANGYAQQTGYDPRGIGSQGWGMVTGYSMEEVAQIPRMEGALLERYTAEVLAAVSAYAADTPTDELLELAPGYDGTLTRYFWIRHTLFDMTRHVGEMLTLKGQYDRQHAAE